MKRIKKVVAGSVTPTSEGGSLEVKGKHIKKQAGDEHEGEEPAIESTPTVRPLTFILRNTQSISMHLHCELIIYYALVISMCQCH